MGEEAPLPRSPPRYPDLCGRRRLQLEVQILNREVGFLEQEVQGLERIQPVSRCCKDVNEYVSAKADPMIPVSKRKHGSCSFFRWIGSKLGTCFSCLCCCYHCHCLPKPKAPSCCFGCSCCACRDTPCCSPPSCSCPKAPSCTGCCSCCTCSLPSCTCKPGCGGHCAGCCGCAGCLGALGRCLASCCSGLLRRPSCCRCQSSCCEEETSCGGKGACCRGSCLGGGGGTAAPSSCPECSCGCVCSCPRCRGGCRCPPCGNNPCCAACAGGCLC